MTTTDLTAADLDFPDAPATDLTAPAPLTWSARPVRETDHEAVLALFTEPDFFFRTTRPDTRPAWEILALLDEDTRLLCADGEPVGLYALEAMGGEHACHHVLHLRLSASLRADAWVSAYDEIVRGLRWQREVVRLAVVTGEFDDRGLAAARLAGFTEEGVLTGHVVHDGHRRGSVFLSRIWEPTS